MTRRHFGRASLRLVVVVGALVTAGSWGALGAAAAAPTTLRRTTGATTTTIPVTTTAPPTTLAPATTVAQASTDTTPTAQKSGTVASDPAQKRLRWIIGGLLGLAALILLATIWFWRATRPSRAVTVTEVDVDEPLDGGPLPRPAIPTTPVVAGAPVVDALPIMAVNAPLPMAAGGEPAPADGAGADAAPPAAATTPAGKPPLVPAAVTPSPPPLTPADVYGSAVAPPEPPPAGEPDPGWFEDPDPPQFEPPDAPRFEEPDPPRFEQPAAPPAAEPEPAVVVDARVHDDDEPWEPRTQAEPPPDDGEQWRGIKPLGPVPRGE